MVQRCSKNIKGTIFWVFWTVLDGPEVVLSRFGERNFFSFFGHFYVVFLVNLGPCGTWQTSGNGQKWPKLVSEDKYLMFLDRFICLESVFEVFF